MKKQVWYWAILASAPLACSTTSESRFGTQVDGGSENSSGSSGDQANGNSFSTGTDNNGKPSCVQSPKNYDIPGNGCDDDGDGATDNVIKCDDSLSVDGNAADFAKALGLCRSGSDGGWGVLSAEYRGGYNKSGKLNNDQHGILAKFGDVIKPREGARIGVISSGYAREFNASNGQSKCFVDLGTMGNTGSDVLPGYPKQVTGCTASKVVNDVIVVRLKIRVPANAKGIAFDFNFFTSEWPAFVCSNYNDAFLAVLKSEAFNGGTPENISFDPNKNPVSVNNDFFDRCTPNVTTGCLGDRAAKSTCAAGENELRGTGYYCKAAYCGIMGSRDESTGGGATGWLETKAPVKQGEEIQLDFMIWDTGDSALNSSTLIDNFRWEASDTTTVTERPR